jgi:Stage II sporulation protein E (SpoIIE)
MTSFAMALATPWLQQLFPPLTPAELNSHTPQMIFGVLLCCISIAFLSLWRVARDFRAFLMLGLFYAVIGVEGITQYFGSEIVPWLFRCFAVAVLVEAAAAAMQLPKTGWTRLFWPVYLVAFVAQWLPSMQSLREWPQLWFSEIALLALIIQAFRAGGRTRRLIAGAFLLHCVVRLSVFPALQHLFGYKNYIVLGGWRWQYTSTTLTLLGFFTLAIFVRELIRDREEKQRLAAELEAGRAVQQMIISRELPNVPGFHVDAVYQPHGDVGGDFFQVIPLASGGALIAIGDVSGKGVPAAMMVSLLVGALHTLAETTVSPAELLAGLNRRAWGRSCGGFTTCLILRLGMDGTLTAASAGHLAPYIDGRETAVENGLPLGLMKDAEYTESDFVLASGTRIALVTDGVVEARAESGELFGFARTEALSTETAEKVARSAQAFGQEDDITVLTLARAVLN